MSRLLFLTDRLQPMFGRTSVFRFAFLLAVITGMLFMSCDSNSGVNGSHTPNVSLTANPSQGKEPLETTVKENATDLDSDIVTHALDTNYVNNEFTGDIEDDKSINYTTVLHQDRTFAAQVTDDDGNTSLATITVGVQPSDTTPPSISATAEEDQDNYGAIYTSLESDEVLDQLEAWIVNKDGTDSTRVLNQHNLKQFSGSLSALVHYQPGDTAKVRFRGTDKGGNTTTSIDEATVDGVDVDVQVYRVSVQPGEGLVTPQSVLRADESNVITETDAMGQKHLEDLVKNDTLEIDDENTSEIGEAYENNVVVRQDGQVTAAMLENFSLADDDNYYDNSLQLFLDMQGNELRIPPSPNDPFDTEDIDEIYPISVAVTANGTGTLQEHVEAAKDGLPGWNGGHFNLEENYEHVEVVDDTTVADFVARFGNNGARTDYSEGIVWLPEATENTAVPPRATKGTAAHEGGHVTRLVVFNQGHPESTAYNASITNQERPDLPTITELEGLHAAINLRRIYDYGKDLTTFDPE